VAIEIRKATRRDLPRIAKLAGGLVRQHYAFDPQRFLFIDDPEAGYEWWFGKELDNPKALILSAKLDGKLVGYAYARLEPRDWNALLDAHGALHDIYVDESARRRGIAKQLLARVAAELRSRGAPRLVLHTAVKNRSAQKLFQAVGFRKTMLEMTCELK
jgi:ribosomal protein S18 acetylase RimI-like enzyme